MSTFQSAAPAPGSKRSRRGVWLAGALGWYALGAGFLSFMGWVLNVRRLTTWGGAISIQPNAALAAAAAGAGLVLLAHDRRRMVVPFAVLTGLIGFATLLEHAWSVNLGVDALFTFGRPWAGTATVAPGRMGPPEPPPGPCWASACWRRSGAAAPGRPALLWGSRPSSSPRSRSSAISSVRTRSTRWRRSPPSPCRPRP